MVCRTGVWPSPGSAAIRSMCEKHLDEKDPNLYRHRSVLEEKAELQIKREERKRELHRDNQRLASPRNRVGRSRKHGPRKEKRTVRLVVEVTTENRRWLEEKAAYHTTSMGQALDDILDCLRTGVEVQIKTYVPKFIAKAEAAKAKRAERHAKIKARNLARGRQDLDSLDDGSEAPEF